VTPYAPLSALVVEPDASHRGLAMATLASAGFLVSSADGFHAARQQLTLQPPAVLVAGVKLGEYNGLHLVLRAKASNPRVAAVVIAEDTEHGFDRDARDVGATLVGFPVSERELLAAVFRTLFKDQSKAGDPIQSPFERRLAERRNAAVVYAPDRRESDRRRPLEVLIQSITVS
jgi:DNA-binding response OmpR family regulator